MKRAITSALVCGLLVTLVVAQDIPLSKILVEKEDWREVAKVQVTLTHLTGQSDGSVKVYANKLRGVLDKGGKFHAEDKEEYGLGDTVTAGSGRFYFIAMDKIKIVQGEIRRGDFRSLKLNGLADPTCRTLWPDEGHLVIGESDGAYLWAVRIEKDGRFGPGDRYYRLQTKPGVKMHVAAMTMDAGYLLYACTPLGIQVFDPTGRLSGVIAAPSKEPMTAITIGGEKADTLFIAAGDKIFARKIQGKAPYTLKKAKRLGAAKFNRAHDIAKGICSETAQIRNHS